MLSVLGISYKTAPVEVRERFSIPQDQVFPFAEVMITKHDFGEMVILSTCNRTEIYYYQNVYSANDSSEILLKELVKFKGEEMTATGGFYSFHGNQAVEHLFKVTSGVESMVLGEDQIIGQVKDAYMYCTEKHLTDAILMRLFQKSFEAGKRVRTETLIRQGATSVSQVASDLCVEIIDDISSKTAMLVGAGDTGALTAHILCKKGVNDLIITNRTFSKAQKIADEYGGRAVDFSNYQNKIAVSDIILVATGAQTPLVTVEMVNKYNQHNAQNPLVIIDLSIPRNVEKAVGDAENVKLFAVDDLQPIIQRNQEKRLDSVDHANQIICEVAKDYSDWLSSRSLKPAIQSIIHNIELINKIELEAFDKADTPEQKHIINEYGNHLTKKYTRMLIKNLKDISSNGQNTNYIDLVNDLFKM